MSQNIYTPKSTPKSSRPLLRFLLLLLIITLPIIGFWLGSQQPTDQATTSLEPTEAQTSTTTEETASPEESEEPEVAAEPVVVAPKKTNPQTTKPTQTQTYTPTTPTGPTVLTVFITSISHDEVSVDNIGIYEGDAAIQQMIRDGLCPPGEPQKCFVRDDIYYRNTDPTVQTYALSPEVNVLTWTGSQSALAKVISREPSQSPYSITIHGGLVTEIKEIYHP